MCNPFRLAYSLWTWSMFGGQRETIAHTRVRARTNAGTLAAERIPHFQLILFNFSVFLLMFDWTSARCALLSYSCRLLRLLRHTNARHCGFVCCKPRQYNLICIFTQKCVGKISTVDSCSPHPTASAILLSICQDAFGGCNFSSRVMLLYASVNVFVWLRHCFHSRKRHLLDLLNVVVIITVCHSIAIAVCCWN